MRRHRHLVPAAVGLCLLAAVLAGVGTRYVGLLRQGSAWLDDVRLAYFAEPRPQNADVIVLTIDEEALAELPFRSPISRRFVAGLVDELAGRNVRALGLDLIFDQATFPDEDRALLAALERFPAPVVVAAGDARNGLTPGQLEFQRQYLAGHTLGSASVLMTDGVVRHIYPDVRERDSEPPADRVTDAAAAPPGAGRPGFAAALAAELGVTPPSEPRRLYFRARAAGGGPWIRSFPARHLAALPPAWFEDAVVLIGADLPNQDRFETPLSVLGGEHATMPGVAVHAQALAQLLSGETLPAPGALSLVITLALAALLAFGLPYTNLHIVAKVVLGLAVLAAYWGYALLAFDRGGAELPLLAPTLAFLLSLSFGSAYARRGDRAEKRFIREAFQRYVSPAVIENVLADPGKLVLGGEKRDMSFVFSDLSGFTGLAEQLAPDEVVALLQEYFEGMLRIALEFGGTIDRLVGDSVAVFFGAPAAQPDHAARAVRCALGWDRYCEAFRERLRSRGVAMGVTRIGVHAGTAVVGNVGSAERFHYTAHGDSVNTAARLESVNKHLGTRVCVSRDAARHCPEEAFRPVGRLVLKGKTQALECVTLCDGLPAHAVEEYIVAYELLERDDPRSERHLAALHEKTPGDPLVAFHLGRLRRGERGTVVVLAEK